MDSSGLMLILMVLTLGFRHGFDLDHLSTIDSITRTVSGSNLSKMIGMLFSLGHGLVVTTISIIMGSGMMQAKLPVWLDHVGNWISIFFLLLFGALTLWNVFKKPKSIASTTLKSWLLRNIIKAKCHPLLVMLIGALFAFSFDTLSQVALFSISASIVAGWLFSGILGLIFMSGMMISDGLNGLFVSILIERADSLSIFISRLVGVLIAAFSLIIGLLNLAKIF